MSGRTASPPPDQDRPRVRPRVLVVVHEAHASLGRLAAGIAAVAQLDERRPDLGHDLPQDLSEHDGLIVLGGSMGAWEDEVAPWLPATRRLLAEAVERSVPTLGICLGGQLLALATGGRVGRGDNGLEVGLVPVRLTDEAADDPMFASITAALGPALAAPQWHQDAITQLPAGAVLLGTGSRYPHQAFRLGECAWGLQYHPEVTVEDWSDWMSDYHGALHPEGLHRDEIDAELRAAEADLVALAEQHAAAFAAQLG